MPDPCSPPAQPKWAFLHTLAGSADRLGALGGALVLGCCCLFLAGCGHDDYERRFQRTVEFAEYREKQEANLAREWRGSGVGIRMPKQFESLPEPQPEEGQREPGPADDPRQPDFTTRPLPGLIGAWRADVSLTEGEYEAPAYIYILSNYELWRSEETREEALQFTNQTPARVCSALGVGLPREDQWRNERYPRRSAPQYVPPKEFTAATFPARLELDVRPLGGGGDDDTGEQGEGDEGGPEGEEDEEPRGDGDEDGPPQTEHREVPVDCKLLLTKAGDMQAAILIIVPQNVARREALSLDPKDWKISRVAMSLETFRLSGDKPTGAEDEEDGGGDVPF